MTGRVEVVETLGDELLLTLEGPSGRFSVIAPAPTDGGRPESGEERVAAILWEPGRPFAEDDGARIRLEGTA